MTKVSDLSEDLVGEILSRVPLTSLKKLRSTCKHWNSLSKNRIFPGKATAEAASRKQFNGLMLMNSRVFSMKFDLQGVCNNMNKLIDPISIKKVRVLNQTDITQVFHCDGLVLCGTRGNTRLIIIWNPYLGQTRSIEPKEIINKCKPYLLYDDRYVLGYDNKRNHKILSLLDSYDYTSTGQAIRALQLHLLNFEYNSSRWRVLETMSGFNIVFSQSGGGVSLKGNTYFAAKKTRAGKVVSFLLCFDFTTERFAPHLPLPHDTYDERFYLSCVREEKLAVLYHGLGRIEVYVTDKIEPNAVSWSKFLNVEINVMLNVSLYVGSFFVDEEKKVVVVSCSNVSSRASAEYHIIGESGCLKSVKFGEPDSIYQLLFTSYVPSLVNLRIKQPSARRRMTKMSDLSRDLVEEILSRVPLTSLRTVRSTCKSWNALSNTRIFCGKETTFTGFVLMNYRIFSINFDLQGVRGDRKFVNPSKRKASMLGQDEISQVFHCDGLLLCVVENNTKLLVWNPYLGQIKWIKPRKRFDIYNDRYVLGYDNNRNHKILRLININNISSNCFELYDFNSSSWRVLDVNPFFHIEFDGTGRSRGVSLKGNIYFFAWNQAMGSCILCFDFTTESFASSCLPLPCDVPYSLMSLSCVREEKLAIFYQGFAENTNSMTIEIYVTDKIETNAVSWSKFSKMEFRRLSDFPSDFFLMLDVGSFFIDEEKRMVVVVNVSDVYIIGEDGYFKTVKIKEAGRVSNSGGPPMFSSYVPSLVQLQTNNNRKRKERDALLDQEEREKRKKEIV